ncbi:hypothetical protein B296_00047953 [Ensete ventricosum]|uniref:Uncharacterized protein n=1 Tax=Ensete ventricosum TaxID=4639 RepID=A0A426XD91_ENSVE|nr:hypothetical protein B296_00047953 [Ensete ventricosum]
MKGDKAANPLTLEEYAGFFRNYHLRHHLSHDQLNQVQPSSFGSSNPQCRSSSLAIGSFLPPKSSSLVVLTRSSCIRSQFPVLEFLREKSKKEKKREDRLHAWIPEAAPMAKGPPTKSLDFLYLGISDTPTLAIGPSLLCSSQAFIVAALNSLDLMRPDRSTVQGQVATPVGVALSLEEAKQDIAALGWQECPLGSIITVGAAADAVEAAVPVSVSTSLSHSKPSSAAGGGAQHKSNGKKKRKRMSAAVASQPSLPPQM